MDQFGEEINEERLYGVVKEILWGGHPDLQSNAARWLLGIMGKEKEEGGEREGVWKSCVGVMKKCQEEEVRFFVANLMYVSVSSLLSFSALSLSALSSPSTCPMEGELIGRREDIGGKREEKKVVELLDFLKDCCLGRVTSASIKSSGLTIARISKIIAHLMIHPPPPPHHFSQFLSHIFSSFTPQTPLSHSLSPSSLFPLFILLHLLTEIGVVGSLFFSRNNPQRNMGGGWGGGGEGVGELNELYDVFEEKSGVICSLVLACLENGLFPKDSLKCLDSFLFFPSFRSFLSNHPTALSLICEYLIGERGEEGGGEEEEACSILSYLLRSRNDEQFQEIVQKTACLLLSKEKDVLLTLKQQKHRQQPQPQSPQQQPQLTPQPLFELLLVFLEENTNLTFSFAQAPNCHNIGERLTKYLLEIGYYLDRANFLVCFPAFLQLCDCLPQSLSSPLLLLASDAIAFHCQIMEEDEEGEEEEEVEREKERERERERGIEEGRVWEREERGELEEVRGEGGEIMQFFFSSVLGPSFIEHFFHIFAKNLEEERKEGEGKGEGGEGGREREERKKRRRREMEACLFCVESVGEEAVGEEECDPWIMNIFSSFSSLPLSKEVLTRALGVLGAYAEVLDRHPQAGGAAIDLVLGCTNPSLLEPASKTFMKIAQANQHHLVPSFSPLLSRCLTLLFTPSPSSSSSFLDEVLSIRRSNIICNLACGLCFIIVYLPFDQAVLALKEILHPLCEKLSFSASHPPMPPSPAHPPTPPHSTLAEQQNYHHMSRQIKSIAILLQIITQIIKSLAPPTTPSSSPHPLLPVLQPLFPLFPSLLTSFPHQEPLSLHLNNLFRELLRTLHQQAHPLLPLLFPPLVDSISLLLSPPPSSSPISSSSSTSSSRALSDPFTTLKYCLDVFGHLENYFPLFTQTNYLLSLNLLSTISSLTTPLFSLSLPVTPPPPPSISMLGPVMVPCLSLSSLPTSPDFFSASSLPFVKDLPFLVATLYRYTTQALTFCPDSFLSLSSLPLLFACSPSLLLISFTDRGGLRTFFNFFERILKEKSLFLSYPEVLYSIEEDRPGLLFALVFIFGKMARSHYRNYANTLVDLIQATNGDIFPALRTCCEKIECKTLLSVLPEINLLSTVNEIHNLLKSCLNNY